MLSIFFLFILFCCTERHLKLHREIRARFRTRKTALNTPTTTTITTTTNPAPSSFPTDCSKSVPLFKFFVCASVVSSVVFVLSLFVPHLYFFRCLVTAVLRDCGISWVSSLMSHDKTYKMACAPSEDSDQPGHPPSLIRVLAVHSMDF